MTPASFFTGAPPGSRGQKKEIEKPRPSPAGPRKSLYAVFSARETSLVHPLKVDSRRMREAHTMVAMRLKPRITILLKCRMLSHASYDRKRTARKPTEGSRPLNTTRLNGSCLCAISQLGLYMSRRSWPIARSNGRICSLRIECRSNWPKSRQNIVLRKTRPTDGRRSALRGSPAPRPRTRRSERPCPFMGDCPDMPRFSSGVCFRG